MNLSSLLKTAFSGLILGALCLNPVAAQDNDTSAPTQPMTAEERLKKHEERVRLIIEERQQTNKDEASGKLIPSGQLVTKKIGEILVNEVSGPKIPVQKSLYFGKVDAAKRSWINFSYNLITLEILHTFGKGEAPGNIAVSPEGRIFISLHQFYKPELKIAEVKPDGSLVPYPNGDWQRDFSEAGHETLHGVLGLRCDRQGILWMLDRSPGDGQAGKLVGWDTRAEKLHRVIMLDRPIIGEKPFLNDLAVDRTHNAIYITDTAAGADAALIVVDLNTGTARRVMEGSPFTVPKDIDIVIDGEVRKMGDSPARIGVNAITVDPTNEWVYFAPMSDFRLYRVKTTDLLNASLTDAELQTRVQIYGMKPICDGITVDSEGNVYLTAITQNAISVINPSGGPTFQTSHPITGELIDAPQAKVLFTDERLSWPDGMAITPDGHILTTVNQFHRSPVLSGNGTDKSNGEYYILKFKSPFPAVHGR